MATIPTPEQGKPILDFSAGTFDGSSNLFQSRNGATEHVSGDDVADYVNTSRIYNTLETESKTPVGAINEINAKDASDISYDNTSSGLNATDVQGAIDEVVDDVDKLHMRTGQFNSANPLVLPIPSSAYGVYIIFGFFQGIGTVLLDVRIVNRAISKIYNLRENTEFSSSNYSFTYSSTTGLTITSTIESQSYYTALYS